MLRRYFKSQRSQAMTEFALIAPVLLLMVFGVVDFGRAIYFYTTINQAANEGARVAVRDSDPEPNNTDVQAAVEQKAQATVLAPACANGPIPVLNLGNSSTYPSANTGWIYITEAPAPSAYESNPPPNAPAGFNSPANVAGCNPVNPACNPIVNNGIPTNNIPLQVTVRYNFVPITPLIQQAAANRVVLQAYATYRTEC